MVGRIALIAQQIRLVKPVTGRSRRSREYDRRNTKQSVPTARTLPRKGLTLGRVAGGCEDEEL